MVQRVLQENPRSKRSLGKPRLSWEDEIRKDFLNVRGENYRHGKETAENKKEWKRFCNRTRWS